MRIASLTLALGTLAVGACNLPNDPNQNGPSVSDYTSITSLTQLQTLVSGILRGDRVQNENEILYGETIGRDGMRITGSEPRFVSELLGPRIDPSDFLGGALWPYATVRLATIGLHGVGAADASVLGAAGKAATTGYIQTIKALELLRMIETRDTSGAGIDVDVDPLGPLPALRCKSNVVTYLAALLDSAATSLASGGTSFPFVLPPGFSGFNTPATFLKFNRGLAAKVDVYLAFMNYAANGAAGIDQVELDSAQAALNGSFMVQNAAQLDLGPAHSYSTGSGDATNGLFDGDPTTTNFRANPRVVAEAEAGDQRLARKVDSSKVISVSGESSPWVFLVYTSPTTPTPILTNKELLLLQAEVSWGKGNYVAALAQANFIRTNDGGLAPDTATASDSVLNRILYEKRYSLLWQSASRWLDARLFGKLNGSAPPVGLGQERGYSPLDNFPIPANEALARSNDLTRVCTP
jgi:starch-binding outer membrane protein, SusD/RagB family